MHIIAPIFLKDNKLYHCTMYTVTMRKHLPCEYFQYTANYSWEKMLDETRQMATYDGYSSSVGNLL